MFVLVHGASEVLAEESEEVSLGVMGSHSQGMSDKSESSLTKSFSQGCHSDPSRQLCVGYAVREVNPESIAENTSVCCVKFVLECQSQRKTFKSVQQYGFYS